MNKPKSHSWDAYAQYNSVLRTWFVAFGVGVPATFLVNNELAAHVRDNPMIFKIFLLGAASQVGVAFFNKVISWCTNYNAGYIGEAEPKGIWQHLTRFMEKFKNFFLMDIICDLITICCFAWALYSLANAVLSGSN